MRKLVATTVLMLVIAVAAGIGVTTAQARVWKLGKWSPGVHNTYNAVYWTFCGHRYVYCYYGNQAIKVVKCETGGTYSTWAKNGQYVNIFQMGKHERETYGWHITGSDPWRAARAGYNYFMNSGKDWSPWTCKPW